jgi:hypothetical protein
MTPLEDVLAFIAAMFFLALTGSEYLVQIINAIRKK